MEIEKIERALLSTATDVAKLERRITSIAGDPRVRYDAMRIIDQLRVLNDSLVGSHHRFKHGDPGDNRDL